MNKEETIARYGEDAYEKILEQSRAWREEHKGKEEYLEKEKARHRKYHKEHKEEEKARNKKYRDAHPEEVKANSHDRNRRGGKHYVNHLKDKRTGLQGERNRIRTKHARQYRPFKDIIAPDSQIHHEWAPPTAKYTGLALVEANAHRHGIVDVIEILDGEIILLTEEEIRKGEANGQKK
jgi:hypothetical protein